MATQKKRTLPILTDITGKPRSLSAEKIAAIPNSTAAASVYRDWIPWDVYDPARRSEPTNTAAGTKERVEVYRQRQIAGLDIFNPADSRHTAVINSSYKRATREIWKHVTH